MESNMKHVRMFCAATVLILVAGLLLSPRIGLTENEYQQTPPDFWMRDCPTDNGSQPSSSCASFFWGAPDVTIENHEGPGSDVLWDGGFNRMRTKVYNRGGNDNTRCRTFSYYQPSGGSMPWDATDPRLTKISYQDATYLCEQYGLCDVGLFDFDTVTFDVPAGSPGVPFEWLFKFPPDILNPDQHYCFGFVTHPIGEPNQFPPGQTFDPQTSQTSVTADNNVSQINIQELYARAQSGGSAFASAIADTIRTQLRAWNTTGVTTAISFTMDTSGLNSGWSASWSPTGPQVIPNDSFFVVTLTIATPASQTHGDSSYIDFKTFRLSAPATITGGVRIIARSDLRKPSAVTNLRAYCAPDDSGCCPPWLAPWCAQLGELDFFAPLEWSVPRQDTAGTPERVMFFYVCRSEGDPNVDMNDVIDSVAVDMSKTDTMFQYVDTRGMQSDADSVYYRVFTVDPAHRLSNPGNRIFVLPCRWRIGSPASPSNPHPAHMATNVDINTNLSWNASGGILLDANFDSKPLNVPIGNGGPTLGEPSSQSPNVGLTVRSGPFGTRSLECQDIGTSGLVGTFGFDLLPSAPVSSGIVTVQCDLWFDQIDDDSPVFSVRGGTGSMLRQFASVYFHENLNVTLSDESGYLGAIGTYAASRVLPIMLVFDFNVGLYDVWLDGIRVVSGRAHGITDQGIDHLTLGYYGDPDIIGRFYMDNLLVTRTVKCPITYDVYFGTSNPPPQWFVGLSVPTYEPGPLAYNTTYYWKVCARQGLGSSCGPVWQFTTGPVPTLCSPIVIDSTWWDEQTTGTDLRRVDEQLSLSNPCVHFAWTGADIPIPPDAVGPYAAYATFDALLGTVGLPAQQLTSSQQRGRYASVAVRSDNTAVVADMDREDVNFPYSASLHDFIDACNATQVSSSVIAGPYEYFYPTHDVGRIPTDYVHVIASRTATGGPPYDLVYLRYRSTTSIWEGPVVLAQVDRPAYSIDASSISDKVAVSYITRHEAGGPDAGNIAYIESSNGGQSWLASLITRNFVTNYRECDTSDVLDFCEYAQHDITSAFDPDDELHLVWTNLWTFGGAIYEATAWSDLWHWSTATGSVHLVYQGPCAEPSRLSAHDLPLSKPTIGVGTGAPCMTATNLGYLYVVFTKFDGGGDCFSPADASAKGFINGELFMTRSANHGVTWSQPENITNTNSNGCDPASNYPCASEHWPSLKREVFGSAQLTYVKDADAGAAEYGDGDWTANAVIYHPICNELTNPCIETTPNISADDGLRSGYYNSNFFIRRSGRFSPGYNPNGGSPFDMDTVRIFNNGTGTGEVTLMLADQSQSWLRVNGATEAVLSIPAGGSTLVELSWHNNGIFTPVSTVLTVDDGTPQDFQFSFTPTVNPVRFLENLVVEVAPGDSFTTVISVDDPLITYAPPGLRALSLPPTASFTDDGDGTGRFTYQRPLASLAKMATQAASDTAVIEAYLSCGGVCTSTDTLLVILSEPGCSCPCKYDPQCDGVISNVQDVVVTVNVAFRGVAGTIDPGCPRERTDVDANGFTNVQDVVAVVNVAFRGQSAASSYVDPCNP